MRRVVGGVGIVLAALLFAGCTAGGSSGVSNGTPAIHDGAQSVAPKAASGDKNALNAESQNRSVVTTGTLSLTVDKPTSAASEATRIVDQAGGRVDAMTEQPATDTQRASATMTLRIPSAKLDATLERIKKLGSVNSVSTHTDDVTTQVKDVDARITALQTSVDRLLDLMSTATNTADLISIESALSDRQADLDSLKAQQNALKDQVSLATIALELHAQGTVAAAGPGDFFSGLAAGWGSLIAAGAAFLVFLGVALPWLALLAVLAAIAWGIVRIATRGRRAHARMLKS